MGTKALFIGRFQPFHLGHLNAIKQILKECDEIIIGIGSAQYSNTKENPLPYNLRQMIIEEALQKEKVHHFTIMKINDLNNDAKWVRRVLSIVGPIDVVYSGNSWVKKLFTTAGITVKNPRFIIPITGTIERQMIIEDHKRWRGYLHPTTVKILQEHKGLEAIKQRRK
ncbi:nicotinamide-nucleotide adenylyltransferase [Candidatus Woesearchaeota archaeon]|nr:nicotinamide-nucleotide adenylyltransferase [Candidatus Woesearchaeota archaeon]